MQEAPAVSVRCLQRSHVISPSKMAAKEGGFQWPWQYNFPPFFTIQPNLDTRSKQIDAWCSLVLEFHKHSKKYELDVKEATASSLFRNDKINRILCTNWS